MLTLRNIKKYYSNGLLSRKRICAADNVNLTIRPEEVIGLVGPSGSGKSTIGKIILGLEKPDSGHVLFQNEDISNYSARKRRNFNRKVQMAPQHPDSAFNPKLKLGSSIREVFKFYDICPKPEQESHLESVLARLHLHPSILDRKPDQISGGEIQRLAIARAILLKPELIVLDEVTSMLDVSVQAQIIHLLLDIHHQQGTAYVFITHNIPLAQKICHHIFVVRNGALSSMEA